MTDSLTIKKGLGLAALCTGLLAFPLAAHADAASEIMTAATHAGFAAKAEKIQMVHAHMHHAINCLVGPGGEGFDKAMLDPCTNNGKGAIPDTADAAKKKQLEDVAAMLRKGLTDDTLVSAQKTATDAETTLKAMK